jgi:cell division protein FtsA
MSVGEILVGLDIGTTKIAAVIGRRDEHNKMTIMGVGHSPSTGLRRGVVIDIKKTVESIKTAVKQAELFAGHEVNAVYAGIAGDHIRSINSKGVIAVSGKDKIITEDDVERVINAARAIALPMDREILHTLPQEYIIDNQDGIKTPIGMAGTRLEAEVHIITAAAASAQNIVNCIREAGYDVADIVLEPYASSLSVLHKDEKELGVAIIDIGGGTTDIAMFYDGSIRHTSVIGIGGEHVTRDLAQGLRTSHEQAESIKIEHGIAMQTLLEQDEVISIPGLAGRRPREISRGVLAAIIQPRMEELFALTMREMENSDVFDSMGAGIVLTGGASLLEGTLDLAEEMMGMPVKLGIPNVGGGLVDTVNSPIYATGVGLLFYADLYGKQDNYDESGGVNWIIGRLRDMFENLFK